jgi:hypothetical protein
LGCAYLPKEGQELPLEPPTWPAAHRQRKLRLEQAKSVDFFDAKGILKICAFQQRMSYIQSKNRRSFITRRVQHYRDEVVGSLGGCIPTQEQFGIEQRSIILNSMWSILLPIAGILRRFPLLGFPTHQGYCHADCRACLSSGPRT